MSRRGAIFLGLVISATVIMAFGYLLVPKISFSPRNSYWNGLSELESTYDPVEVSSLKRIQVRVSRPNDAILFILGPSKDFSEEEARIVENFVESGGRLVLADDFGTGNELLREMGISARFSGMLLKDPVFKIKDAKLPKIFGFSNSPVADGVSSLAFNLATTFTDLGLDCEVIARSSKESFVTENIASNSPLGRGSGSFPLMCEVEREKGKAFLISDSSVFVNSMLRRENNRILLGNLIQGRMAYLDTSHWEKSPFVKFQNLLFGLYNFLNQVEMKYGLLLLVTVVIFKIGWNEKGKEVETKDGEVEEILKRHPGWDRNQLEKLEEGRRREA